MPQIRNHHHEDRHLLYVAEELWAANWKCVMENAMEAYHLSVAHRKTLHHITPTALCRKLNSSDQFTSYRAVYDPSFPERKPYNPDLTPEERSCSVLSFVFPTFATSYAPNYSFFFCIRPITAAKTAIRWGITGNNEDINAPEFEAYRNVCIGFNAEDRAVLERLQKGLNSRYLSAGPLAAENLEGTIWDFYKFLSRRLSS
jgi:phenylpropionate dioxygenase-like ring-hydroxylating dioxygenase large terminal subunit